jgi:hypothetical protein
MLKRASKIILFAAVLSATLMAVRMLLIEPDEVAAACLKNSAQWFCWLREWVIKGFVYRLYGWISVGAALLAWITGVRLVAVIAVIAGVAGVVWYDFELAAMGLLCGALLLMRGQANVAVAAN